MFGVCSDVKRSVRLRVVWSFVRFTVGFVLGSVQCGLGSGFDIVCL